MRWVFQFIIRRGSGGNPVTRVSDVRRCINLGQCSRPHKCTGVLDLGFIPVLTTIGVAVMMMMMMVPPFAFHSKKAVAVSASFLRQLWEDSRLW